MKPREWGPNIWYLLHTITYNIPDDNYFIKYSSYYVMFFNSLKQILPCPICRGHLKQLMNKNDINNCKTKNDLIEWCINRHNDVNKKLSKTTLNRNNIDNLYKTIDIKRVIKAIDLLVFNFQYRFPINHYKDFFNSLRVVFPNETIRLYYQKGMKLNDIQVINHTTLIQWYMKLGEFIIKNLNNKT